MKTLGELSNYEREEAIRKLTEEVMQRVVQPVTEDVKILANLVNSGMPIDQACAEISVMEKKKHTSIFKRNDNNM